LEILLIKYLKKILHIRNSQFQVKFSELTLDMFRVMQTIEETDLPELGAIGPEPAEIQAKRRPNPQKYLLYRPSYSQFIVFLANAFKVITIIQIIFLFFLISAGA